MGQGDPALRRRRGAYFAPCEGSATLAYGIYHVASRAARLHADPAARAKVDFAQAGRLIWREDRTFLRRVDTPATF